MRHVILLVILGGLAGCATLNEEECRGGDWAAIGYEDGTEGRLPSYLAKHGEACAEYGIAPDRAAWEAGRQRGLAAYCTPLKAYSVGRRGGSIAPVCAPEARAAMQAPWEKGRRWHRIEREVEDLEREARAIRAELSDLGETPGDAARRATLSSRLRFVELDIFTLELEQRRYDW